MYQQFYPLSYRANIQCVAPAEGVQTLSEHDALSWLQRGKADGTVDLLSVGNKVMLIRQQKVHVVLLPLHLLSLSGTREGKTQ